MKLLATFLIFSCKFGVSLKYYSKITQQQCGTREAKLNSGNYEIFPRNPIESFIRFSTSKLLKFGLVASTAIRARADDKLSQLPPLPKPSRRPFAYSVEMTSPPTLIPRSSKGEDSLLTRLSRADVTIFGYHKAGKMFNRDIQLQSDLITRLLKKTRGRGDKSKSKGTRELAIGLPLPANPEIISALEAYSLKLNETSMVDVDALLAATIGKFTGPSSEFSFQDFLPLLHLARDSGVLLIPLDVSRTVTDTVLDDGLGGLPEAVKTRLVPDTEGFLQSVSGGGFKSYSDNVLLAGYGDLIRSKNGTGTVAPFENYIASRIIRDEVMAARAAQWKVNNPNSVLLLLLDADQTKFGYGIQERIKRNLAKFVVDGTSSAQESARNGEVLSVLLNPTPLDSYSPTVQLRLSLAYGVFLKDQKPLSDFLWFSDYPPVKILTRSKNPINAEGEKPPGESSILKAF